MISSLLIYERANRSHDIRSADNTSERLSYAYVDRAIQRDHSSVSRISLLPQTLLTQRSDCEAALSGGVLFFNNQKSSEA
jgi:hypothetical protein